MRAIRTLALASLCWLPAAGASAQDYFVPYIGWFDIVRQHNESVQFGMEYRFSAYQYGIRPMVGINADTDSNAYIYAGLAWDIPVLGPHGNWFLTPNFAVGAYHHGNDGRDLGGPIEFRSGIEASYELQNESRIGMSFNHISNASIYDRNPGAETLLVNYHIPMGWFSGGRK